MLVIGRAERTHLVVLSAQISITKQMVKEDGVKPVMGLEVHLMN